MLNKDIISMPDKWEYPWYAAWDLAFHTLPLAIVDPDFAKDQMKLMLKADYLHPSGQLPAYEWNYSDVNPPVHAWATLFLHRSEQALGGEVDFEFIKSAFNKFVINFTWWVNRKDRFGKNVFEGGFLGLDNIGVFDRSAPLPTGGHLEQADGTAWMALFAQNMLELAIDLAGVDPTYEDMAVKFAEHFYFIARAMNQPGADGMWDEEDGFYYDLLRFPDGSSTRLKVRSMVGLLPLCATTVTEPWQRELAPGVTAELHKRLQRVPELRDSMHPMGPGHFGVAGRGLFALVNPDRLRRILAKMLDEDEFLSPFGSLAMLAAIFVSNLPEAIAGSVGMKAGGASPRKILFLWCSIALVCARASAAGFVLFGDVPARWIAFVQAFAGGAILMMLANSMMPEAYEHGGKLAGVFTVLGFCASVGVIILEHSL